jgi:short-subunit dehydrogenase
MDSLSNDNQKVLIVGASSQIGRELVNFFYENGWIVFATVSSKKTIPKSSIENVTYLSLNLQKTKSIQKVIAKLIRKETKIDVVINSAGLVLSGAIEAFTEEQIRRQMEVNFFGVAFVVQAILPSMRENKGGVIVNVSSLCGLITFPLLSIYHASKWALEGFSESIYYELQEVGVKVKLIEPGGVKQSGGSSNIEFAKKSIFEYEQLQSKVHSTSWFPSFSETKEVAEVIYNAAIDNSDKLRYIVGTESTAFLAERGTDFENESYLKSMRNRFR